jgi:hypothetical protein
VVTAGPGRFLCRARKPPPNWVVVSEVRRAERFDTWEAAEAAREEHVRLTSGHIRSAGGDWQVMTMKARYTFS